jgi:quercetin dioxygenase-like cupin family protein
MVNNIRAISKNEGEHISVVGDTYRIIVSGKQSGGAYAIIDMQVPPGGGPPPHAHPLFHESFYVVDGEIEFKTEAGRHIAQKGDLVNIPKGGAIHGFKNISKSMARLLCTVVPAGLDDFFLEIGTPVKEGEFLPVPHPDEEELKKLRAIAEKYGQVLYPPDYLDK